MELPQIGKLSIDRVWAMPNKWTFKIPPIADLIRKYTLHGMGWADPFSGRSRFAEFRNDLNPINRQPSCVDAADFMRTMKDLAGVLFDPPYSMVQVARAYQEIGIKDWQKNNNKNGGFPSVKDEIARAVRTGGHVISFGWNTSGMGTGRGFKMLEVLVVCHGGTRNDTLCTVEQKLPIGR